MFCLESPGYILAHFAILQRALSHRDLKNGWNGENNKQQLLYLFANNIGDRETLGVGDSGALLLLHREALFPGDILAHLRRLGPAF